jgi:hypothetical protein
MLRNGYESEDDLVKWIITNIGSIMPCILQRKVALKSIKLPGCHVLAWKHESCTAVNESMIVASCWPLQPLSAASPASLKLA